MPKKGVIVDWRPLVRHVRVTDRLSHGQEFSRRKDGYYYDYRHDLMPVRKHGRRLVVAGTTNAKLPGV